MPEISFIIPLFNKKTTVKRAIDSILKQVKHQCLFEIIIVNDGSTDGSLESISCSPDLPIIIYSQENKGVSSARNKGALIASYDYLFFLDADDELLPCALETMIKLIEEFPLASHYTGSFNIVNNNSSIISPRGRHFVGGDGYIKSFSYLYSRYRGLIHSSSVCIRKSIFLSLGGFPEGASLGEDIYFWIRLSEEGLLAHTPKIIALVHRDAPNRTADRMKHSAEIPFFVTYYKTRKCSPYYAENPVNRSLIFKLSLLNQFGFVLSNRQRPAFALANSYRDEFPRFALLFSIALIPRGLIYLAQKLVHQFMTSSLHLRSRS